MITKTHTIPEIHIWSDYYGIIPEECLFFDIETTGLSSASASVFLIGIISYSGTEWMLTQWMTQNPQEESLLLQTFLTISETKKTLIHFNGTTFDIPFIKERSRKWNLVSSALSHFENMQTIDLYQNFRPLKKIYNLERLTQQSLEQFSGWKREDQLTGKHMIDLYTKYTASLEPLLADLLLLHNHDDLYGMIQLLPLTSVLMLQNSSLIDDRKEINLLSDQQNHTAAFHFSLSSPLPAPLTREGKLGDCCYHLQLSEFSGKLIIQTLSEELRYFFPDYKNYYYLPAEDHAIHKSIGIFVDSQYRQNAKPANCYTKKSGIFLPQIKKLFHPAFQKEYTDKTFYFEISEDFTHTKSGRIQYLKMMAAYIFSGK